MGSTLTTMQTLGGGADEPSGPSPLYVLRVVSGRDKGKSVVLDWNTTPSVLVGQSRVCEVQLSDPRVSRRHLAVTPYGHAVRIQDLGTSNGTRIGGVLFLDALLTGGEEIAIGDSVLRLVRVGTMTAPSVTPPDRFGRLLGQSDAMHRVFVLADRLAASELPIVIEGETGTGKALLAEAIHDAGSRAARPFVVHDASAHEGDDELSTLFALVEQASGGTLVIDEVGDLGDAAQARLVPILERGDVRVLATTRRDLDQQVQKGALREEFIYRLNGARIALPPLRARTGDVELLARHFWSMFDGAGEIPSTFLVQLAAHDWPGNVRELEHAVARRVALGDDLEGAALATPAAPADLIEHVLGLDLAMSHARALVFEQFADRYVARAMAAHGGNVARAAAASGVTRRYFHMLLAKQRG